MAPADEGCARFVTTLVHGERQNGVGFVVPAHVVELLGAGKRPPVKVTINGYTYRTTIVGALEAFEALAYSHRRKQVRSVNDAKAPETRERRIKAVVEGAVAATK